MPRQSPAAKRLFAQALRSLRSDRPNAYVGYTTIKAFYDDKKDAPDQSDRALVLVCTSLLEMALEDAISTHFEEKDSSTMARLFTGDAEKEAPLQSLYARTYLAYALGVFGPDTLEVLNIIRQVRNHCAHDPGQFSFDQKEISHLYDLLPFGKPNALGENANATPKPLRHIFLDAVSMYYVYFFGILKYEGKAKRYRDATHAILFS